MHFSARAVVGLLGRASISSAMPVGYNSASALPAGANVNVTAITNTTENINTTDISASALHEITNVTEKINITIPTTGITNDTEDLNTSVTDLPQFLNGTTDDPVFLNDTYLEGYYLWLKEPPKDRRLTPRERRSLVGKRGDLPPRDRTLADHMENHGENLPGCYKKCMRSEDGKSSIHMGKDTLGQICGAKWGLFAWWSEHHIYWCVNGKNGCQGKQPHRDAYKWLKATCGDKPK